MEVEISEKAGSSDPNADPDPDPIVYQLVRVDDDGKLVPATDEDLVVEDLLEDEKAEQYGTSTEQGMPGCETQVFSLERNESSLEENQMIPLESVSSIGKKNIKKEETVHTASPSNPKDTIPSWSPGNSGSGKGVSQNDSSVPDLGSSSKPNFSKLRGEVCLDKLSVDELRETFRATFGRQSSVKDREWLQRRISMALSNSCDFSATTFIIKDIDNVEKGREKRNQTGACSSDYIGVAKRTFRDRSGGNADQAKICSNVNDLEARTTIMDQDYVSEDHMLEGRAAKRIRKPTKRYIEQLSEAESGGDSGGRLVEKSSEHEQPHIGARVRSMQSVMSSGRPTVTGKDSLGGSGVMVPYAWRARRRSRPRVNLMPFMNQPIKVSSDARMVKETTAAPELLSENETEEVLKARMSPTCAQQPLSSASEESEASLGRSSMELDKGSELSKWDPCDDNSDDYTGSTLLGTARRKHHRPWSLAEVEKLVDGVSTYGIGRWSEIKRLVFASSTYRTSVDLKDKWRNLIRASSVQLSGENANPRKHASTPIPATILERVRELAEEHGQAPVLKLPPCNTRRTMEGFL